jgi:transcriptional regulator with XRE-family HTH domain
MSETRFRRARRAKGLSQRQLAERTGLARCHVQMIETGKIVRPTLGTLLKLSLVLGPWVLSSKDAALIKRGAA